jgi:2-keto-3-deoxy-L-rhamnonate aldolase RhmA
MMRNNLIREKVNQNAPMASTRIWSTNPFIVETIGASGQFDYVEFCAEYAPFSQIDLENICRAAELYNMGSMIKIDLQNRGYIAQKAIASGFQAVLFADHYTPEQVEESIKLTTPTTPECGGHFGYPMRRFIGTQSHLTPMAHAARIKDIVRCFMIEKGTALDHIDEICSIPGVDMVQFGSGDWSMNLGFDRNDRPQDCKDAEAKMIEVALKHGVRPRCEVKTAEDAKYYKSLGVKDIALDDDMYALRRFWFEEGAKFRKIVME